MIVDIAQADLDADDILVTTYLSRASASPKSISTRRGASGISPRESITYESRADRGEIVSVWVILKPSLEQNSRSQGRRRREFRTESFRLLEAVNRGIEDLCNARLKSRQLGSVTPWTTDQSRRRSVIKGLGRHTLVGG